MPCRSFFCEKKLAQSNVARPGTMQKKAWIDVKASIIILFCNSDKAIYYPFIDNPHCQPLELLTIAYIFSKTRDMEHLYSIYIDSDSPLSNFHKAMMYCF